MYMGDQVLGYTCTMCSKFYKMWSNYLKHKCEPPQFKCPLCPFAAFKAFILHAHQAEQHFKVTSPNTMTCVILYSSLNVNPRGILPTVTNDRSNVFSVLDRAKDSAGQHDSNELTGFHVCCECKKTYRSRMALNRHVREECGRILYTCPFCHNIMPMKFNLLNHLKKEHGCVTKI
ncbi:PREDICTED: zinc finger Y-chromosomal protein 2-like [Dinoponera quadriceps]|uniref:Zinc finger Y-chromosomal protein 2-like n=1 Tax=Dinoponera quadriceps TaxID=609295 RepID=A0A6P3XXJ4_DINQU|nr:PREDICTED: zinc finger Y-chromosomal protein 2-like [Dinoponera quadriceps]